MNHNAPAGEQAALIIKLGAIGDVVMAIPAADALRQKGYAIDWVCGRTVEPLLRCYPWIRTIVADERALLRGSVSERSRALIQLWRTLAGRQYQLCATLYYDPRYRLIAMPIRAKRKLILSETSRATRLLPGRHHTDEYTRILLGEQDGERQTTVSPLPAVTLPPSPLPRTPGETRIILVPAGARNMLRDDALRRWPAPSYVELAKLLLDRNYRVVLAGGPDDTWVLPFFADLDVTSQIGTLSLPQTLALFDDSDVVVTHDTGPLHLAAITRAAIVAIFGPTDPRWFLPRRSNSIALWGGEGFGCRPCYDGRNFAPCQHNGCVQEITSTMVLEHVEQLLKQRQQQTETPFRIIAPARGSQPLVPLGTR